MWGEGGEQHFGGIGHHFKGKALHCLKFFGALRAQVSSQTYSVIVQRSITFWGVGWLKGPKINISVGNGHHFMVKAILPEIFRRAPRANHVGGWGAEITFRWGMVTISRGRPSTV